MRAADEVLEAVGRNNWFRRDRINIGLIQDQLLELEGFLCFARARACCRSTHIKDTPLFVVGFAQGEVK